MLEVWKYIEKSLHILVLQGVNIRLPYFLCSYFCVLVLPLGPSFPGLQQMHLWPLISLLIIIEESWTVNTGPLVTHRPATEPCCIQNTGSKAQILPGARGHYFPPDLALSFREGTHHHHGKPLSSLTPAWQVKWTPPGSAECLTLNNNRKAPVSNPQTKDANILYVCNNTITYIT